MEKPVRNSRSYKPLTRDKDEIGDSEALYQAAYVLDLAAGMAHKSQDVAALLHIAELWMTMGKIISPIEDSEEPKTKLSFGLGMNPDQLAIKQEGEENGE